MAIIIHQMNAELKLLRVWPYGLWGVNFQARIATLGQCVNHLGFTLGLDNGKSVYGLVVYLIETN